VLSQQSKIAYWTTNRGRARTRTNHPGSLGGVIIREATTEADISAALDVYVDVAAEGVWIGTEAPIDREARMAKWLDTFLGNGGSVMFGGSSPRSTGSLRLRLVRIRLWTSAPESPVCGSTKSSEVRAPAARWSRRASSGQSSKEPTRFRSRYGRTTSPLERFTASTASRRGLPETSLAPKERRDLGLDSDGTSARPKLIPSGTCVSR
jgi:hypothetical protein